MTGNPHQAAFAARTGELEQVQRELLDDMMAGFLQSEYGQAHTHEASLSAEQYTATVPLIDYETIRPWVEKIDSASAQVLTRDRTIAFFKTSGSTSKPKLIPVTASLMRQKVSAFATFWGLVYRDHPVVASGAVVSNFIDAGSAERHAPSGLEIISESSFWSKRGRSINSLQRWPLPAELRLVKDRDARLYAVARLLLQGELHCIMCLNPSTLLQFCRTIETHSEALAQGLQQGSWGTDDAALLQALKVHGKVELGSHLQSNSRLSQRLRELPDRRQPLHLATLWPMLELIICWRSDIVQPYFTQLAPYIEGIAVRDYISQSSECIMAIPVEDGTSGGALAYASHFFEFIPESSVQQEQPDTLFAWQLERGMRYELVVTTGGGLYRYRTGDCIQVNRFIDAVPVIEFLHRLGKTSSITGEKLTEQQVLEAARVASTQCGYHPAEFLLYPCSGEVPHYSVMLDPNKLPAQTAANEKSELDWFAAFESALRAANSEYRDKCDSGRLGPLALYRVAGGALAEARTALKASSVSDEQVKSEVLSSCLDRHLDVPSAVLQQPSSTN